MSEQGIRGWLTEGYIENAGKLFSAAIGKFNFYALHPLVTCGLIGA
jgi:hypothetical protein